MSAIDELAKVIELAAAYDYWPQEAARLAIAAGYGKLPAPAQVAPFGFDVTSGMVREVWDTFVKPDQDADLPQSAEMRVLMAILRNAFAQAEAREGAA